jgi:hypothetical protein
MAGLEKNYSGYSAERVCQLELKPSSRVLFDDYASIPPSPP